jgi:hypothetical protein
MYSSSDQEIRVPISEVCCCCKWLGYKTWHGTGWPALPVGKRWPAKARREQPGDHGIVMSLNAAKLPAAYISVGPGPE